MILSHLEQLALLYGCDNVVSPEVDDDRHSYSYLMLTVPTDTDPPNQALRSENEALQNEQVEK
jgi:hypothetical protein